MGIHPALERLNRGPHPEDVQYSCILAIGSPGADDWEALGRDLGSTDLEKSPFLQGLVTRIMALNAFRDGIHSLRGDGAILAASQDLREVDFFRRHSRLIQDCISADVGHQDVNEQHRVILAGISSPVRFLAVRRVSDPGAGHTKIEVDFHDYFAGLTEVVARSSANGEALPVSRPVIVQSENASFGQVMIGPFDSSRVPGIDLVVRSLDRGRRYGKQILLRSDGSGAVLPKREQPKPIKLTLLGLDGIPSQRSSGLLGEFFSSPDIELVLSVDQHEVFRSKTLENADRAVALHETELNDDPRGSDVALEVWHVGVTHDLMGRILWHPGEFPRHAAVVRSKEGLAVHLDMSGTDEDRVYWNDEPFSLASLPTQGRSQ